MALLVTFFVAIRVHVHVHLLAMAEFTTDISPCHNYVYQLNQGTGDLLINVFDVSTKSLVSTFKLNRILRRYRIRVENPRYIKVKQIEWDETGKRNETFVNDNNSGAGTGNNNKSNGRKCQRIAVLVDSSSAVLVLNIKDEFDQPIIIRQNPLEGIDHFAWIPTPPKTKQTAITEPNYIDRPSSQIVVFAKHNLYAKVYSLLFSRPQHTIFKPLLITNTSTSYSTSTSVNNKHNNSSSGSNNNTTHLKILSTLNNYFWYIIADSLQFNSPRRMYKFYNDGTLSTLVSKGKLSIFSVDEAVIQPSPSGTWLVIIDESEQVFGYNMKLYGLQGNTEGDNGMMKPILDVNWSESENADSSNHEREEKLAMLKRYRDKFQISWAELDGEEIMLVYNLFSDDAVEIQIIPVVLLKIAKQHNLKLIDIRGWAEINGRIVAYNHTKLPGKLAIKMFKVVGNTVFIVTNNTFCFVFSLLKDETAFDYDLQFITMIKTSLSIKTIEKLSNNDFYILATTNLIIRLNHSHDGSSDVLSDGEFKIVKFTPSVLEKVQLLSDRRLFLAYSSTKNQRQTEKNPINQDKSWEVIELFETVTDKSYKLRSQPMQDEITDTFHMRKRQRVR